MMGEQAPVFSGREAASKLQQAGWKLLRERGSHMMLTHPDYRQALSIPDHRQIGPGLLRRLLKQAGLTVQEFNAL